MQQRDWFRRVWDDNFLFHCFVPFLLAAVPYGQAIFLQDPALFHQIIHRGCVAYQAVITARVAFRNGHAWIACLLSFGSRSREWQERGLEGNTLIGCTDRRIAQIPTRIGCKRNRYLWQADAVSFISVAIDLWHQHRKGRAYLGRLDTQTSVSPVRAEIETKGFTRFMRHVYIGNRGQGIILQRDKRSVGNPGIAAWGRKRVSAHPRVHVGDHGAPQILDREW